jgi:DNA/RNA endonuclease YhcR with UshA esterase domain
MNMAYIKFSGQVVRSPTYDTESQYLGFWLNDGTGEVYISAYRDVTQVLLTEGRVPMLGDKVEIAGTLRIREDFISLTLNVPEHLKLQRPEPVEVKLDSLTVLDEGLRLHLVGEVREVRTPYEGLTLLTVTNESGEIVVAIDETLVALTGDLPKISKGQSIALIGTVNTYKSMPQVIPLSVAEIQLSEQEGASRVFTITPLNMLSKGKVRSWVQVQGKIVALEGIKGGLKATLDDGTAQVPILLWENLYMKLPKPSALDIGARTTISGILEIYEEALEIVPEAYTDIKIEEPAPPPPWLEVREISTRDVGQVVRLRGVLGQPEGFSAGVKFPLDDGTGTVQVLLWANIFESLSPSPEANMTVEVIGQVSVYQNRIEIIPRSPVDWRPIR